MLRPSPDSPAEDAHHSQDDTQQDLHRSSTTAVGLGIDLGPSDFGIRNLQRNINRSATADLFATEDDHRQSTITHPSEQPVDQMASYRSITFDAFPSFQADFDLCSPTFSADTISTTGLETPYRLSNQWRGEENDLRHERPVPEHEHDNIASQNSDGTADKLNTVVADIPTTYYHSSSSQLTLKKISTAPSLLSLDYFDALTAPEGSFAGMSLDDGTTSLTEAIFEELKHLRQVV